jgi:predicted  nucleic acid-binding Zn-ribbon protein
MHPDLTLISNLWQCDAAIDRLKAELEGLNQDVAGTLRQQEGLEKQLNTLQDSLASHKATERDRTRELEDYQSRKAKTQALLDSGTPNYASAERQLAQCNSIIDGLETELLGLMDAIESTEGLKSSAEKSLQKTREAASIAAQKKAEREPLIRAEYAEIVPKREAALKTFPAQWAGHYQELRRKKRPALVNVEEEACVTCSIKVPAQRIVETRLARAVHYCPGCQGFLLP